MSAYDDLVADLTERELKALVEIYTTRGSETMDSEKWQSANMNGTFEKCITPSIHGGIDLTDIGLEIIKGREDYEDLRNQRILNLL